MKKNQKGFVFIETIIVTCVLLSSLMVVYALYITSVNTESRYTRYDDPVKLYQSYYFTKYLEGFDFRYLIQNIKEDCNGIADYTECNQKNSCSWQSNACIKQKRYEMIWQGRSDIFGPSYNEEALLFDSLWENLRIRSIYVLPNNIAEISKCEMDGFDAICSNNQLITYLKGLDDIEENKYYVIFEFSHSRDGSLCNDNSSSCLQYYSYMTVGE